MKEFREYQKEARRTNPNPNLTNAALGLCGESGEVADLVKKITFQGKPLDNLNRVRIAEELGDVLWYVACACDALGIGMDTVAEGNILKLRKRYPDGFSVERSEHRD